MKIICKKMYTYGSPTKYLFIVGEPYIYWYDDSDDVLVHGLNEKYWFSKSGNSVIFPYIYEYFYTVEELRKIKIDKLLNESIL